MPQLKHSGFRQLLLILFAAPLIFATCKPKQKQTVNDNKLLTRIDSLKRLLDSCIIQYRAEKNEIKDSVADSGKMKTMNTGSIYVLESPVKTEKGWFETPKDFIPWILTVLGLLVGYFGFMRTSRFKSYDFLGEVNKLSIANPDLYAIYEDSKENISEAIERNIKIQQVTGDAAVTDQTKKMYEQYPLKYKLRAFCFYKLNNLESTFQNYKGLKWTTSFYSWEKYSIEALINSELFLSIAEEAIKEELFDHHFTKYLIKYKAIAIKLKNLPSAYTKDQYKAEIKATFYRRMCLYQINLFLVKYKWWVGSFIILILTILAYFYYNNR